MADARRAGFDRQLTPRRVFGALALLLVLVLLLMPWSAGDDRAPVLSSYGTAPGGARGLHDVLDRLGFRVERRLRPMRDTLATDAVYLVLAPSTPLTAVEVTRLLEAVRAGAGLLAVPAQGSRLADSLGITTAPAIVERDTVDAEPGGVLGAFEPPRIRMVLRPADRLRDSRAAYAPEGATTFVSIPTERGREPVVVGVPLGRGHIILAAETAPFGNAALRTGEPAVRAVRLVEWLLRDDVGRTLVFDEYHHGYGIHADVFGVAASALFRTPPGRMLLTIGAAGLLLLLAIGVRPIRPAARHRIQRRSPLEHVGALASAYAAVPATARATRLLVRGLRRRHGGSRKGGDEVSYLRAIAAGAPHVSADVARVLAALSEPASAAPSDSITTAILRIEKAIT